MRVLLVIYDNDSYTNIFPLGHAYIASALLDKGHDVEIYNQDIHHYPDEHLTQYLNDNYFDVVGLGIIGGYYQYKKLLSISKAINDSNKRPFYVLGGHGPAPEPEYFLKKTSADVVVIGEGEKTIVDLLATLEKKGSLSDVKGIAFRDGKNVTVNPRRPLIENIDDISLPAHHLFPMEIYRLLQRSKSRSTDFAIPVLSGRGCNFKCNFCYRMDAGFRGRSNEGIINEVKSLKEKYRITYVDFSDELLMVSEGRIISLCEDLIKEDLSIRWSCSGRLNFAKPHLIKIMKKAGCVFINYGIECFDNQILKNMNKQLNTRMIVDGVETTLKEGIVPGLNVIFGNIGENRDTLKKSLDFLLKYSDFQMRTIRPVTPCPGSPLYYYAIEKGLLKGPEDFYENKHLNSDLLAVNFTDLTDEEFHRSLLDANTLLIEDYMKQRSDEMLDDARNLYLNRNVDFRGFRQI